MNIPDCRVNGGEGKNMTSKFRISMRRNRIRYLKSSYLKPRIPALKDGVGRREKIKVMNVKPDNMATELIIEDVFSCNAF